MKECRSCKITKSLDSFSVARSNKDGYNNACKPCIVIRNKLFYRTENGIITGMYNQHKLNSKGRNHLPPSYTKKELVEWLYWNGFKKLYDAWVTSKYVTDLKPSVDRLDSTLPYTLANIRLVTWEVNNKAAYSERKSGKRLTRQNRPINQLTVEGVFVKEYPSISNAARENSFCRTNINSCIRGAREIAHGYRWEYSGNNVPNIPTIRDVS